MKMLNKNGFVFVETLIVTIFVVTLFIMVYQNIVPNIGEYEKMVSYDDVDSVYASNLMKQVILKYADLNYVDEYLNNHTYIDMTNCSDKSLYRDEDYCVKIKNNLSITDEDYVFITKYDITNFREEVKENDFFDSGKLSNFRGYVNQLPNVDSFYNQQGTKNVNGKYRLFMTRTVTNSDLSTSLKYVNIGIFLGTYSKYNIGDVVTFNPGDGDREFYVLKNSSSKDSTVTLILANNLPGTVTFNSTGNVSYPDTLISKLKTLTDGWVNANILTDSDNYVSGNGYTVSYTGGRARLLNDNDIYMLLGCETTRICFDINSSFATELNSNIKFLSSNLTTNGYWMAATNNGMAWTVKNSKIIPNDISDATNIGIRPVIIVDKDKLK